MRKFGGAWKVGTQGGVTRANASGAGTGSLGGSKAYSNVKQSQESNSALKLTIEFETLQKRPCLFVYYYF